MLGANCVVEASDVLNKLSDAKLHLKSSQKSCRIRHKLEVEERKKTERGEDKKNPSKINLGL